jgi:hypothetical protein
MRRYSIILLLTIIFAFSVACGQSWQWATSAGRQNANEGGFGITTDINGNVYGTGFFGSSTITFGSTTLTNAGVSSDVFIVKYDGSGNVIWAKRAGGINNEGANGITSDLNGNVYITGWFESPFIVFDSDTLNNTTPGIADIFIAKYDSNGNVIWVRNPTGTFLDKGNGVSSDSNNDLFVTGCFYSSTITFDTITLTRVGTEDVFLVKYDSNGNVLWAKSAGGMNTDIGNSVANDSYNNSIITGFFQSPDITFGNITLTNTGINNSRNIFTVKYDVNGNVLWANGANGSAEGNSIVTDLNNNIYVTGTFYSDTIIFGNSILINTGFNNIFLAKYDSSGNTLWAKRAGGESIDFGYSVTTNNNNVFVAGTLVSDTIIFGNTTLYNYGSGDILILQYDLNGNEGWIRTVGGPSDDYATGISVDTNSNIYITGTYYSNTISFGNTILNNGGQFDFFLANLNGLVGIIENHSKENISFSPNPFSVQTVLHSENYFQNAILTIDNSLGQTVAITKNINGNTIVLNRNNLQGGIYFIQLTQDNQAFAKQKIIITD